MFTFTDEMIRGALEANGWQPYYGDTWLRSKGDSDRLAVSTEYAFGNLLIKSNLLSNDIFDDYVRSRSDNA